MALTIKEVEHVALLARLELDDFEKELFAQQLSSILEYVDKLNELDTDGVEPLAHILPIYNIFRKDEVKPSSSREEILANAPLVEIGQYKVPKIM
ncbi:Aspartyl/glutamyl-tRNA(Asn/Gln) amidotransferase, C subunit [Syntrophomonas zehnderi OL-4]|uniref:Aspartyl/glutamyl-tRNA(Asn/Gln) amidotransferase subunit C n=1 Tax=Syntrophomonas zehnderi OL-4 TaxID=690567 RepID=A0A0E4GCM9_9FIRM|nr:Asp-tRNA(Asn)/Glu-tRNA(Gln) amidotransferase subunit GatC [Syntrophomonas zehnderi]CFY01722.1 Aspartyl/glutamyl-tRNA(Asn/Gln) amidotransferase, C subunit [Syntrophomonas zehnderi OL-4]